MLMMMKMKMILLMARSICVEVDFDLALCGFQVFGGACIPSPGYTNGCVALPSNHHA